MTSISPTHVSHELNVIPSSMPVIQTVRRFHLNCHQIIQAKVDNLLDAGFIKEVKYPEWLANVVVVPKKGGKWRVCAFRAIADPFLGFMVTQRGIEANLAQLKAIL